MNKLNFSALLKNVKGEEVPLQTLAKTLSEILGMEQTGKTLKLFGWHRTLQTGTVLQLDDSDLQDLKSIIENNTQTFVFVKGQLLEVINNPTK